MLSKTHTKYIQSLQHKKFRDEHNCFIAEGPKLVLDILGSRQFICREILAIEQWINEHQQLLSSSSGTVIHAIKDFELEKISALSTPYQVLAVFEKREQQDIDVTGKITLALDTIQDPGNLGTIIRIADWFGIQDMICSHGCADIYNPKVVQSTMGSISRVNIVYSDLPAWLKQQKKTKIYSASLDGKELQSFGKIKEGILIIGNEAHGISGAVMDLVNEKITIPRVGEAESLNAAVATGIILSHIC
jgi:RNA methyltransferase, TrmH family